MGMFLPLVLLYSVGSKSRLLRILQQPPKALEAVQWNDLNFYGLIWEAQWDDMAKIKRI